MLLTRLDKDVIDSVENSTTFFSVPPSAVYNGVAWLRAAPWLRPEHINGLHRVALAKNAEFAWFCDKFSNRKILEGLTERKKLDRKRCTSNTDDRKLEYCQAKLIPTLGSASQGVSWSWSECIKSHHAQMSSGKGLPSHFWNRNIVRRILPGIKRKITGLLLSGPKSSFKRKVNCAFHMKIKVPGSGGRVERNRIHVAWSPVWSFHSQ